MKKIYTTLAVLSLPVSFVFAQGLKYCGTDEAMKKLRAEHPEISVYEEQLENETKQFSETESMPPVYTIPIVFHILHDYGVENISDAQIKDAVRILNDDYRKLNADTSAIVPAFVGLADDAEIQFALPKLDPSGNCTNGIDRIATAETYIGDDGSKLNQWPRNKYLNVWVVNTISSGAAGYSYYPSATVANPAIDGVMILHDYVGSIGTGNVNQSRALTHEIGHYLNLAHTWGSTNQPGVACGDDGVTDTPVTKGWTSCNLSGSVCNPPIIENVQNYMEYAYCSNMYTTNQVARMRAALISATASRNNLWTATNLAATGVSLPDVLCKADFSASKKVVCAGDSTRFTDNSWNGTPTSWSWTFPGGAPASSIDTMPWVTYNTPGQYNVSLTATNASGSPSTTKNNYITVMPNSAQYTNSTFSEGFETGGPLPNTDWKITSNAGPAWSQSNTVAYTGTKCMWLNNLAATTGDQDIAYSPSIDLSAISNPKLYFRIAFAQTVPSDNDNLRVYVSTNCGVSWIQRYTKSGTALSTVPNQAASFAPTSASQWRLDSVSIAPYASSTNFIFKFEFHPASGNNIYIDDINIFPIGMIGINETLAEQFGFSIFPNPVEDNSTVSFTLPEKKNVSVKLFDVVGREVSTLTSGTLDAGEHTYTISGKNMNAGVYFIKFTAGDKTFTNKVVMN